MRNDRWLQLALCATLLAAAQPARTQEDSEPPPVPKLQDAASDTGRAYEKITMTEAVRRALARNVTTLVALAEIDRAQGLLGEARAPSMPSLIGSAAYTRLDNDRVLSSVAYSMTGNTFTSTPVTKLLAAKNQESANLTLNVPLVSPSTWVKWSQARTNLMSTRAGNQDARRTVALLAARAYLAVIAQKRQLDINARALATDHAHYDYAHTRLVGGVGNRVDDVRAAQQVASDEALLSASYTALARAREALGMLLGEDRPIDVFDDVDLPKIHADPTEAVAARADVVAARTRVQLAEQTKNQGWADYTPTLLGQFMPFYQNPPSLTVPETGWQAMLVLTVPFFEGGIRWAQNKERAALLDEARSQYDALLRQTRSDIRIAVEEIGRADEAMQSASSAARLAREALDLANRAYRAGATSNLEVIDAERRARDADSEAVIAEDTVRQARLDLLAAAGQFP
jgi:outer membrane protein TolC